MFLVLPLHDDLRTRRFPFATALLVIASVGVFAAMLPRGAEARMVAQWALVPAVLLGARPPSPGAASAWLTLFSSMFLHGGVLHLLGNMLFLGIFGTNVEDALGSLRFLLFYVICGLAAAMTQALAAPASPVPMLGASGAIAGVLAAYWIMFPQAQIRMLVWIVVLLRTWKASAWWWILLWMLAQMLSAATARPGTPGVAWWAHLGGFLAGLFLLFIVCPGWIETRRDRRRGGAWR